MCRLLDLPKMIRKFWNVLKLSHFENILFNLLFFNVLIYYIVISNTVDYMSTLLKFMYTYAVSSILSTFYS